MLRKLLLVCLTCSLFLGCNNPPSTLNLDNDIADIESQIQKTQAESNQYSGGLIKSLVDVRLNTLKHTKSMLELKRHGINRFISISYKVNGEEFKPPEDGQELQNIEKELANLANEIKNAQAESDRYAPCLIKTLIDSKIATMNISESQLRQKQLSLKHRFPIYFIGSGAGAAEEKRVPMKGSAQDNL